MAVLTGYYARGEVQGFPSVLTQDLGQHTATFGGGAVGSSFNGGAWSGSGVVALESQAIVGTQEPMFGWSELFGKVLVIPRSKDVGFLLSSVVWDVEVWNTDMLASKALTNITISGAGGLQVSGGLGSAANFGPGQASIYTATLGTDGDATIATVATWNFTGETGADMTVTGTRITVFSPEIDWSDGFTETIEFKTDVLSATSGQEQRVQLRTKPRYGAAFRVVTLEPRDSAAMDALLFGWQGRMFGVPWWPDASMLTAQATPGATSLQVDTTGRASFEAGGLVMLWADQHAWEALGVLTVASGSVALSSQVAGTWPVGTIVVPMKLGRMAEVVDVDDPVNWASIFQVSFDCEVA
ncbi:MAG: hypothetical protein BWY56_01894 [Acidobacteria bacterium ADurb.Bin340]|nr:MAG: hypothetical protein BWY56_01894 [Acidobacteria bacterium ADurb.Bin340]